mgnify:CR=1 FL=1
MLLSKLQDTMRSDRIRGHSWLCETTLVATHWLVSRTSLALQISINLRRACRMLRTENWQPTTNNGERLTPFFHLGSCDDSCWLLLRRTGTDVPLQVKCSLLVEVLVRRSLIIWCASFDSGLASILVCRKHNVMYTLLIKITGYNSASINYFEQIISLPFTGSFQ